MNTNTTNRAAEIRASLQSAEVDLSTARLALGEAVADGNESAAKSARAEVARAERLTSELRSALPIAERRAREAAQVEAQRQQKAREKAANVSRARRIDAAKKVDKILAQLGRAYDELIQLDTGGTEANRGHTIRRQRYSARGAFAHFAPNLSRVLEVPVIPSASRRPMAESESGLIHEFPEVEAESA